MIKRKGTALLAPLIAASLILLFWGCHRTQDEAVSSSHYQTSTEAYTDIADKMYISYEGHQPELLMKNDNSF